MQISDKSTFFLSHKPTPNPGAVFPLPAQAGVPTFDETAVSQMMTELQKWEQQLTTAASQLTELEKSVTNEATIIANDVRQAAAPVTDLYKAASGVYRKTMDLYNKMQSMAATVKSAKDYLQGTYGTQEFWEQCFINGCDPTHQLESATAETQNAVNDAIIAQQAAGEAYQTALNTLDNIANNPGDGANQIAANTARANATGFQQLIVGQESNTQAVKELTATLRQQQAEEKAMDAKASLYSQAVSEIVTGQQWMVHDNEAAPRP